MVESVSATLTSGIMAAANWAADLSWLQTKDGQQLTAATVAQGLPEACARFKCDEFPVVVSNFRSPQSHRGFLGARDRKR